MLLLLLYKPRTHYLARLSQQLKRLWPSLQSSWFNPSRSVWQFQLRNACKQIRMAQHKPAERAMTQILCEGIEQLQRPFETQLSRQHASQMCRLCHHCTHHIVGEKIHGNFLLHHLWNTIGTEPHSFKLIVLRPYGLFRQCRVCESDIIGADFNFERNATDFHPPDTHCSKVLQGDTK